MQVESVVIQALDNVIHRPQDVASILDAFVILDHSKFHIFPRVQDFLHSLVRDRNRMVQVDELNNKKKEPQPNSSFLSLPWMNVSTQSSQQCSESAEILSWES